METVKLARIGYITSVLVLLLASLSFSIAIFTPPLSGPYCAAECYTYPYHGIINRYPRDYYWMFPAIALNLTIVFLFVCIHYAAEKNKKVFSSLALIFVSLASMVLNLDYFIQLFFIQVSLTSLEMEGIAMFSQFNPHGLFIVFEEFGFLMLSFSFLSLAPVFYKKAKGLSIVFLLSFVLSIFAFSYLSVVYGIRREYRFEVVIIAIVWLTLIVVSVMLLRFFKNYSKNDLIQT